MFAIYGKTGRLPLEKMRGKAAISMVSALAALLRLMLGLD